MMPNAHESQRNCRFKDILKASPQSIPLPCQQTGFRIGVEAPCNAGIEAHHRANTPFCSSTARLA